MRFLPGAISYFFSDHLGSSRVLTNSSGTVVEDSDFYPVGGERPVISNDPNQYKFTGKERDSESGLDNYGSRYYGSSLGRFMSPDEPLVDQFEGNPQSWNLYAYVRNNPLSFIDPTGQSCITTDDGLPADDGDGKGCEKAGVDPDEEDGTKGEVIPHTVEVSPSPSLIDRLLDSFDRVFFLIPRGVEELLNSGKEGNPFGLSDEQMLAIETVTGTPGRSALWKFGKNKSATRWANQMAARGWTADQITEAIEKGQRLSAVNRVNPNNTATRYVHPTTGRSIVVDDVTKEVIHVGADGHKY